MSRLSENSGLLPVFLKFRFSLIWFLLLSFSSDLQYCFGYISEVTMHNEQTSREFIQLKNNPFPVLIFGRNQFAKEPGLPFYLTITCAATIQEWEWTTTVELQTAAIQARSQMQILLDTFVFWLNAEEFFKSFPIDALLFWNVGKFWTVSEKP